MASAADLPRGCGRLGDAPLPRWHDGFAAVAAPSAYFHYAELDMGTAVFRLGDSEDNVVRGG